MKELKAPDKVMQKMTHDGAVTENLATGEVTNISSRDPEVDLSASSEERQARRSIWRRVRRNTIPIFPQRNRQRPMIRRSRKVLRQGVVLPPVYSLPTRNAPILL